MYISKLNLYREKTKYRRFRDILKYFTVEKRVKKNNAKFIKQKLRENKSFLDNINGYSLDEKQREIVLSEEDSTLVIAGAGSGKSLTIMAKIMYLVKNGVKPRDIICLSFTNSACMNLQNNLSKNGIDMQVLTFHKLGLNILKENASFIKLAEPNILFYTVEKVISGEKGLSKMFSEIEFIENDDELEALRDNILLYTPEIQSLKKLFITFINLFKGDNYDIEMIEEFRRDNNKEKNRFIREKNDKFLILVKKIIEEYTYTLNKNNQIDFHDMINKASKIVRERGIRPYKYIIIDEYQDVSLAKCDLIRNIKACTSAKLLVVGDDWQSIYRFTGSNLKVFTQFEKYFPFTKTYKLENTYRNSQELLDISSRFILKNKNQLVKKLNSKKYNDTPIYIYYCDDYLASLKYLISKIKTPILVLSRNNKDLPKLNIEGVSCMTVHKSKGLECENVILINLEDKINGFPNKIVSDDVLKYVTDIKDSFPYEEERRLFYVALTRTKNNIYLLVDRDSPSIFVTELLNDSKKNIKVLNEKLLCPVCHNKLIIRYGSNGLFYGCNSYPKCNYTRKIS